MDTATITLIAGIISCVIGVSTFVSGRMARAERNGSMETKINQALEGITSINQKLEESYREQHESDLLVRSHEERIKSLSHRIDELHKAIEDGDKTREVLIELLQAFHSHRGC